MYAHIARIVDGYIKLAERSFFSLIEMVNGDFEYWALSTSPLTEGFSV